MIEVVIEKNGLFYFSKNAWIDNKAKGKRFSIEAAKEMVEKMNNDAMLDEIVAANGNRKEIENILKKYKVQKYRYNIVLV